MNDLLIDLKHSVSEGHAQRAGKLTKQCLHANIPAKKIFEDAIIAGIQEAGMLWDCNRYRVPDMILSADAFKAAVAVIEKHLPSRQDSTRPKVVVGVVEGDVHDLGKNILVAMLRGAGLDVIDLGVDLNAAAFVQAVQQEQPLILGIGAYMSSTMLAVPEILKALELAGLRSSIKVLVGGVPTTQQFADSVGADGWAVDASSAVRLVKLLLG
ncbi:MAG: cobalamin-dependent protein [Anaerolineales bacterium]|nr:cobalamin-dependent protein [Anaerolineales bacterium]